MKCRTCPRMISEPNEYCEWCFKILTGVSN